MDYRSRKCISSATSRCDGRGATNARACRGKWQVDVEPTTNRDESVAGWTVGHRHSAHQPSGRLRPRLQSRLGLGPAYSTAITRLFSTRGLDVGFSFFPGISLGLYFGGCCGWGGWGWGFNWFGGGLFVNNHFFHRYGFREFGAAGFRGSEAWAHDPAHRMGVPYANRAVANRFRGETGFGRQSNFNAANRGGATERSSGARFGTSQFEQRSQGGSHSAFGGAEAGGRAQFEGDHGFHSMGGGGFRGGGFGGGGFPRWRWRPRWWRETITIGHSA